MVFKTTYLIAIIYSFRNYVNNLCVIGSKNAAVEIFTFSPQIIDIC